MGYHTEFEGQVHVTPPLNASEVAYLTAFNASRRWDRPGGPYDVSDAPGSARAKATPPGDQPGLWCPWKPSEDGTALIWDQREKPSAAVEWMEYLIRTFLAPYAVVADRLALFKAGHHLPPELTQFTCNHTLTGGFHAEGEEWDDNWSLLVEDNQVTKAEGHVQLPDPAGVVYSVEVVVEREQPVTYAEVREHGRRRLAREDFDRTAWERAALEDQLRPLYDALDWIRYDHLDGAAPQPVADTVVSAMLKSGYTITDPGGNPLVDDPV